MTSRRVEDIHKKAVDEIMSASGLVCVRSMTLTEEVIEESLRIEESESSEVQSEASPELSPQTASAYEVIEESLEEEIPIFPSPSLRHMLSDRIRSIEEENRVHVLPKEFKTNIDPLLIPKILPHINYIDIIADLVGCTEYKTSLAEFWFLDTMANLLRRAQEDQLPRTTQAVLMLWFCEWMKEIQNFDAADRERMLRRFKDNMLSAARFITDEARLPGPREAGVHYTADEEVEEAKEVSTTVTTSHLVTFPESTYECAMRDLVKIMHYISDLFSSDYQFDLVRSIFTFTPDYNVIDMPFNMRHPKHLYAPLKPHKEKPKKGKEDNQKGKKKEVLTEEYIHLMELLGRVEKEQQEILERDAEDWNMRNSIMPLHFAGTEELLDQYWPPPPPEPVPVVPEKVDAKGKKGKKK